MTLRRILWSSALLAFTLFAFAVGSQFVTATYGAAVEPPAVRTDKLSASDRARVSAVHGVTVLRLSGTHHEMGRQHGAILRDQILFLDREYVTPLIERMVGRKELEKWAGEVESFIPKPFREELRGLAEGSRIPYARILVLNTMLDRFQSMMCSTVVAGPDLTADGEIYFGRNLDFAGRGILHKCTIVIVYAPKDGPAVAAVTWPGLIGVLSGMSDRGVAGATMMIHWGKPLAPGMPYMLMYRAALAGATSSADVVKTIRTTKRTCPNNFMVVDTTGAAVVVEWDQQKVGTRPGTGDGLCSTNFFRSAPLKGTGAPFGLGRYNTLEKFLQERKGKIDRESIQSVLGDVANPWWTNVQSMVFVPRKRELWLATRRALPVSKGPYAKLSAESLFGKKKAAALSGASKASPEIPSKVSTPR